MDILSLAERRDVEITALAGIVGHMNAYSPIQSDDEEIEVVSETYTCTEGYLIEDVGKVKLVLTVKILVLTQCPNIPRVEEYRAMKVSKQTRAVFQVGLQLQVASLFHIPPLFISRMVFARTYAAYLKCPDTVCATHPELFGIRHVRRIAESPGTAKVQMCYKLRVLCPVPCLGETGLYFQELCVGVLEEFLVFFCPRFPESGINSREEISRLTH